MDFRFLIAWASGQLGAFCPQHGEKITLTTMARKRIVTARRSDQISAQRSKSARFEPAKRQFAIRRSPAST
jgi:hypothetical protein